MRKRVPGRTENAKPWEAGTWCVLGAEVVEVEGEGYQDGEEGARGTVGFGTRTMRTNGLK